MNVKVVLYDEASRERIRDKLIEKYKSESTNGMYISVDNIFLNNKHIKFHDRLIIMNYVDSEDLVNDLKETLEGEEVAIYSGYKLEYYTNYIEPAKLTITYNK